MGKPRLPAGIPARGPGARFWRDVTEGIEFRADELLLLGEACRVVDRLAALRRERPVDDREVRLQQEALRKLCRAIDWPTDSEGSGSAEGRALAMHRWRRGA